MAVISNQYTVDAQQAIQTMQSLQQEFLKYNAAVGAMSAQTGSFNAKSAESIQTFTQIDSAGRKVTSTIKETANGYETLSVKVGVATAAQRKYAEELEKQKTLSESFARGVKGGGPNVGPTTTAFPGALDPNKIGQAAAGFTQLTKAQLEAAAASQQLNAVQTATLLNIHDKAQKAAEGFGTLKASVLSIQKSFQEFGQIAFATAIYRGISLIQQGLADGIKQATEYSHQIGLIQTISNDSTDNFNKWSASIRGVADQFGRPVGEVATAAYDALSNQVIKSSSDFDNFGIAASRLARITGGTTAEAVNVLSSILNSYGLDARDSSKITDELFRTVDLGRVRLNELNSVYARTISLGKQTGVSFQEVNSGLVILTQQGLKSNEAATLLNGVFSQLIKPNVALSAQFKQMGFESGEAAVKTLGFAGTMKALRDASKGAGDGLATFFPELKGLRGFGALSEDLTKFEAVLKKLQESGGAGITADKILSENEGVKLEAEFQRIKTFFTVDIGTVALGALVKFSDAFGGISEVVKSTTIVLGIFGAAAVGLFAINKIVIYTDAVVKIGFGFVALTKAAGVSAAAQAIFGASIALTTIQVIALGAALLAIPVVIAAVILAQDHYNAEAVRLNKERLDTQRDKEIEENKIAADNRVNEFEKSTQAMTQLFGRFIARAKVQNDELRVQIKSASADIEESLKNTSEIFLNIAKHNVDGLKKEIDRLKKSLEELSSIKGDSAKTLSGKQFSGRESQLDDILSKRKAVLKKRGGSGADPEGLEAYRNLLGNRTAELDKEVTTNFKLGNIKEAKQAFGEIIDILEKLRQKGIEVDSIESRFTASFNRRADVAQVELNKQLVEKNKQLVAEQEKYKVLQDTLGKAFKFSDTAFDKGGNLIPKYANNTNLLFADLEKTQQQALKLGQSLSKIGDDPAALIQYQTSLINLQTKFAEQRRNLQLDVQNSNKNKALIDANNAVTASYDEQTRAVRGFSTELEKNQNFVSKAADSANALAAGIARASNSSMQSDSFWDIWTRQSYAFQNVEKQNLVLLQKELALRLQLLKADPGNIDHRRAALDTVDKIQQNVKGGGKLRIIDPDDQQKMITYTDAAQKLKNIIGSLSSVSGTVGDITTNLNNVKTASEADTAALTEFINKTDPGLAAIVAKEGELISNGPPIGATAASFDAIATSGNKAAAAIERLAAAEAALAGARGGSGGGSVEGRASGGQVGSAGGFLSDFYSGRFASGTDVIPTMLSKNEYVVRAPMAEKYYSQLVAINSGHAPLYRASGGSVSNSTRVGDINLNIQGGGGMNAPELVRQIRRGIQNNTLKL